MRASVLLVLLLALTRPLAGIQAPADGFYRATPQGAPGERVPYQVRSAKVVAEDNLNKQFSAQFRTPYLNAPDENPDEAVLVIGGQRFEVWKSGWSVEPKEYMYTVKVDSPDEAATVARFFNVQPRLRTHPGYRLATTFRPVRERF